MYNIKIPKDIREYKDKVIGGFTFRQIACLFVAGAIGAPVYYKVNQLLGSDAAGWAVVIADAPIVAVGFLKNENMTLEQYAIKYIKFHLLYPKKRKYGDNNIYKKIANYQLSNQRKKGIIRRIINVLQRNKEKTIR